MKVYQLDTPALILDKRAFDRNRRAMQALLENTTMQFRPHYKSHKCPTVARIQLTDGAKGITCAKLSEAEDLAACGVEDILIANQIVQPEKLGRVAELAGRCRLTLCVDCAENVLALEQALAAQGQTLYCLVEYDIGMNRCGVKTHAEVIELARLIDRQPHLRFDGLQAYAGQMSHEMDINVRRAATQSIEADLAVLKAELEAEGLAVREISGGSTGMVELKPGNSIYTEMQCGSYLFMDRSYRDMKLRFENALFLLTTVISTKPDLIVTDGGTKSLGMDQGAPVFVGYENYTLQMSEEHGQVTVPGHTCRLNDKIRYIPGHCCTTMNSHDKLYIVEGDDVIDVWTITSRGKSW